MKSLFVICAMLLIACGGKNDGNTDAGGDPTCDRLRASFQGRRRSGAREGLRHALPHDEDRHHDRQGQEYAHGHSGHVDVEVADVG